MSKHTPGPWYADKIADRNAFNIFPHGATLALVQVAPPAHDGAHPYGLAVEANARLIAAAPDLLQDLRAAACYIDALGGDSRSYRQTIAKAEGQQ